MKMKAARFSKMSVSYYNTAWCHKPKDLNLELNRNKEKRNLKQRMFHLLDYYDGYKNRPLYPQHGVI
jgi:hypothetical protein